MAHATHATNAAVRLMDGHFYAQDPFAAYRWMRDHAPIYWDADAGVWGVTRYRDLYAIERDPKTFSNAQGIRPGNPPLPYMIDFDDPEHRRRRRLVSHGFTPKGLADHEPRVREICVALIERAQARGRFDFVSDLAAWLPLIVIADMLGVEADAHADLLRWSETMIAASSTGSEDPALLGRASQSFLEYQLYQRGVIEDRRTRPPQRDLVSILCHAEIDGDRLDDDSILYESLLILVGGDETTRHVLVGGMYELLLRPEARAALAADPRRIPTAVEEMLRWVSPIQNMARTATRDVEVEGQTIEAGEKVLLLFPAANRDPAVFPDPERFDVARTPNEHVAFGLGTHFCLGANLARMELVVMFEEILRRLPTLRLASAAPPPRRPSNFVSGIESLPVELA